MDLYALEAIAAVSEVVRVYMSRGRRTRRGPESNALLVVFIGDLLEESDDGATRNCHSLAPKRNSEDFRYGRSGIGG